jgi:hypothetical protein
LRSGDGGVNDLEPVLASTWYLESINAVLVMYCATPGAKAAGK